MINRSFQGPVGRYVIVLLVLFNLTLTGCTSRKQNVLRIAVSSNFASPAKEISSRFEKRSGNPVSLSFGSTGKHYAQIANGAPFDVFLAADSKHPGLLEKNGLAVKGSRFIYATGRLALWSAKPDFIDRKGDVLKSEDLRYIAIANPKLAPYGFAAMEVIRNRGIDTAGLESRIVKGENVTQAFQFVKTGNAEIGFVAYSQIKKPGADIEGSMYLIPEKQYSRIDQEAILINEKPAAREFAEFLKNPEIINLIRSYGYGTP